MMREIKFRGKKKSDGKWIIGDLNKIETLVFVFNKEPEGDNMNSPDDYEVIPETVGQFTGLKDKNGKEIYEGDIISNEKIYLTVVFKKGCFKGLTLNEIHLVEILNDLFEVIGNRQENPELLKKDNNE